MPTAKEDGSTLTENVALPVPVAPPLEVRLNQFPPLCVCVDKEKEVFTWLLLIVMLWLMGDPTEALCTAVKAKDEGVAEKPALLPVTTETFTVVRLDGVVAS